MVAGRQGHRVYRHAAWPHRSVHLRPVGWNGLRRLTNDAFAEVQPAWSPDGRRIAFATDRFTSDLTTLAIGPYRLALIAPDTGAIEAVSGFTDAKHLNPQWSPDSQALYFISDRGGVPNVYRVGLGAQAGGPQTGMTQLTRLGTGVSGITATSPALSVASRDGDCGVQRLSERQVRHLRDRHASWPASRGYH